MNAGENWAAQQLAELLAELSSCEIEQDAERSAIEHAARALESEAGAIVRAGVVRMSVGFPREVPVEGIAAVADGRSTRLRFEDMELHAVAVPLDGDPGGEVVLARRGPREFDGEEANLLRAMGRVLSLSVEKLRTLAAEQERRRLLERLSRIQNSISHSAPLTEVLDSVTSGAAELMGEDMAGMLVVDSEDRTKLELVSAVGLDDETFERTRVRNVGEGLAGRAFTEERLVVLEDYQHSSDAYRPYVQISVQSAMAAPVRERDRVVGTLVVASRRPGRRYGAAEREALIAFASHAGLALTDARLAGEVERATHDRLTGLPNRAFLGEHLDSLLSPRPATQRVSPAALVTLDLDAFKDVNDRFGHALGDELLVRAATRLLEVAGPSDVVARLAGEEFAILPHDPGTAEELANEACEALARPFLIGEREVRVEATAGLAHGAGDAEELIRNAELARDRAKDRGGGCFVAYEPEMRAELVERLTLQDDLAKAIDRNELEVHYQPKVDVRSRDVLGLEALVRWRHPERGLLPPVEFIGIAESAGHIGALTQVVLEDALEMISAWWREGHHLEVSVNLSAGELDDPTLARRIGELLEARRLPGEALELEITESALMGDPGAARATFAGLSEIGVGVSIDDFGTGYSSLGRLKRLPINELKIDRSFVAKLDTDAGDAAIVRMSIDLAHSLGVRVVAEGVETEVAMRMLAALGCDRAQGYLIAKPMPRPELERWLRAALPDRGRGRSAPGAVPATAPDRNGTSVPERRADSPSLRTHQAR